MPTDINSILSLQKTDDIITELKRKIPSPPLWSELAKDYDIKHHDIMNEATYQDVSVMEGGKVVRVPLSLEQLATNRLTGLTFGIPVTRIYDAQDEAQRARYNGTNLQEESYQCVEPSERSFFAGCEIATLWYWRFSSAL